jgi:superfamily II DNA helicase RecQ
VVIDECHLTFTASNYRPKLTQLKKLRVLQCPMVLLAATLPPVLEDELGESMLVGCARYIRAITIRPNIHYMVQWCQGEKLLEVAMDICRRQKRKLEQASRGGDKWKGVIYCRGREQCEELAEMLKHGHYHSESS